MAQYDDLRLKAMIRPPCIKFVSAVRDTVLSEEESLAQPLSMESFVNSLSGNVSSVREQKLVYNLIQDYLATEKTRLQNAYVPWMDLQKARGSCPDYICLYFLKRQLFIYIFGKVTALG